MPLMLAFIKMCCTASNVCRRSFQFLTFLKSNWKIGRARKYVYVLYLLRLSPLLGWRLYAEGRDKQIQRMDIHVDINDLPTLRTTLHCQILIEVKTFSFYQNSVLTHLTDASCGVLRDVRFLPLCSSSIVKTMSRKTDAIAGWDWKDSEDPHQALLPRPCSAPHQVPPSRTHNPHDLPPHGAMRPWKACIGGAGKGVSLPKEASKAD